MIIKKSCDLFKLSSSKLSYNKKAQDLSFQMIVIIAISILVLIVVATIFLKQTKESANRLSETQIKIQCTEDCAKETGLGNEEFNKCLEKCVKDKKSASG